MTIWMAVSLVMKRPMEQVKEVVKWAMESRGDRDLMGGGGAVGEIGGRRGNETDGDETVVGDGTAGGDCMDAPAGVLG